MVETSGFENRHVARHREFESPPLRKPVSNFVLNLHQQDYFFSLKTDLICSLRLSNCLFISLKIFRYKRGSVFFISSSALVIGIVTL